MEGGQADRKRLGADPTHDPTDEVPSGMGRDGEGLGDRTGDCGGDWENHGWRWGERGEKRRGRREGGGKREKTGYRQQVPTTTNYYTNYQITTQPQKRHEYICSRAALLFFFSSTTLLTGSLPRSSAVSLSFYHSIPSVPQSPVPPSSCLPTASPYPISHQYYDTRSLFHCQPLDCNSPQRTLIMSLVQIRILCLLLRWLSASPITALQPCRQLEQAGRWLIPRQ